MIFDAGLVGFAAGTVPFLLSVIWLQRALARFQAVQNEYATVFPAVPWDGSPKWFREVIRRLSTPLSDSGADRWRVIVVRRYLVSAVALCFVLVLMFAAPVIWYLLQTMPVRQPLGVFALLALAAALALIGKRLVAAGIDYGRAGATTTRELLLRAGHALVIFVVPVAWMTILMADPT